MAGIQALSMMCGGHHRSCALATNEMPLVHFYTRPANTFADFKLSIILF